MNGASGNKDWFVMEQIRKLHPLHLAKVFAYMSDVAKEFDEGMDTALVFRNKSLLLMLTTAGFDSAGNKILEKIKKDPEWYKGINERIEKTALDYFNASRKVMEKIPSLKSLSNEGLADLYEDYEYYYYESHKPGMHGLILEFKNEYLSRYVFGFIEKKIKENNLENEIDAGKAFTLISVPEKQSIMVKEEKELNMLLLEVFEDDNLTELFKSKGKDYIELNLENLSPEFNEKLETHFQEYRWLTFMYEGPALEKSYFIENLAKGIKEYQTKENFLKKLDKSKEEAKNELREKQDLLQKLNLNEKERKVLDAVSDSVYGKAIRKDAMYFGCYATSFLFKEVAKRLHLTVDQVRYFMPEELLKALRSGDYNPDILNERIKFSVYRNMNGKKEFILGKGAEEFFNNIYKEEKVDEMNELQGTTAVGGKISGIVRIIDHPNEMMKMNDGDIMVSTCTNPNLVPAMKKAGAIVTDIGGVTCHAAIVSRELKIPCVVGTKYSTRIFKDRDKVEVDATNGIVKKL